MNGLAAFIGLIIFAVFANSIKTLAKSRQADTRTQRRRQGAAPRTQGTNTTKSRGERSTDDSPAMEVDSSDESLSSEVITSEQEDTPERNITAQKAREAQGIAGLSPTVSPAGTVNGGISVNKKTNNPIQLMEIKTLLSSRKSAKTGFIISEILGTPKGLK